MGQALKEREVRRNVFAFGAFSRRERVIGGRYPAMVELAAQWAGGMQKSPPAKASFNRFHIYKYTPLFPPVQQQATAHFVSETVAH